MSELLTVCIRSCLLIFYCSNTLYDYSGVVSGTMSGDDCGSVSEQNCVRAHLVITMYIILMVGVCIYIFYSVYDTNVYGRMDDVSEGK